MILRLTAIAVLCGTGTWRFFRDQQSRGTGTSEVWEYAGADGGEKASILFVCHGNICRSPMAEFLMKDLVKRRRCEARFEIASAATSYEEIGNPVYPPARRKLAENGIGCAGHHARRMTRQDYDYYDLIVCMDRANVRNATAIAGGDPEGKIVLLLDFTGRKGQEVADPWYTGNFDKAWDDISEGCEGLLTSVLSGGSAGGRKR